LAIGIFLWMQYPAATIVPKSVATAMYGSVETCVKPIRFVPSWYYKRRKKRAHAKKFCQCVRSFNNVDVDYVHHRVNWTMKSSIRSLEARSKGISLRRSRVSRNQFFFHLPETVNWILIWTYNNNNLLFGVWTMTTMVIHVSLHQKRQRTSTLWRIKTPKFSDHNLKVNYRILIIFDATVYDCPLNNYLSCHLT